MAGKFLSEPRVKPSSGLEMLREASLAEHMLPGASAKALSDRFPTIDKLYPFKPLTDEQLVSQGFKPRRPIQTLGFKDEETPFQDAVNVALEKSPMLGALNEATGMHAGMIAGWAPFLRGIPQTVDDMHLPLQRARESAVQGNMKPLRRYVEGELPNSILNLAATGWAFSGAAKSLKKLGPRAGRVGTLIHGAEMHEPTAEGEVCRLHMPED